MRKKIILRMIPFLFIFGAVIIFAKPYILENKVPFPSKYLVNFFPPWSSYEKYWGPVKNNAMPDVVDQMYPWKYFTIQTYKGGQVPFWNPYNFSGNPHLANFQSAVLSPFNVLFLLFPFIDAWSLLIFAQPILAGIFTYIFVREIKVSVIGSLIASVAYMFCGFMTVWMAYGIISMTAALLPLILFAIEKYVHTRKSLYALLLSICIALAFFSGHFQTGLYVVGLSFLYIIFKSFFIKKKKAFLFLFGGFIGGLVLSFPQVLPSVRFYLESVRSEIFIKEGGIPFWYLTTVIAPDFFGNPVTRNDWVRSYAEWASFVGVIPFTLSLIAIFGRKTFASIFFASILFITLLLALNSPLQVLLGNLRIPVLSTSNPSRIILLFSFAISVLAAMGFDIAKKQIENRKFKELLFFLAPSTFIIAVIWFVVFIIKPMSSDKLLIAQRNLILPTALFFVLIFMVMTIKFVRNKTWIYLVCFFILVLTSVDSFRFANKWMPFDPRELVFPEVPVLNEIKKNIGYGRIFGNLGTEVNSYYGISSIEGYDPLYIGRYGEFVRSATDGKFVEGERSVVKLDRRGKYTDRVLDLLGVNLIFHPVADTNAEWAYPVWKNNKKYSLVYNDGLFQLFKNNTALPRVHLFYHYEAIAHKQEIIKRFYSDNFDFRSTIILEEKPTFSISKKENILSNTEIVSYTPNKIAIKVSTSRPGILFLSDNYYPGWSVFVNGKVQKLHRANYTFRAVEVPEGDSRVEFFYSAF